MNNITLEMLISLVLKRLDNPIVVNDNGNFKFWLIDDLLPEDVAIQIATRFPDEQILKKRDSIREYKRVGIDFDSYDELMESITYAFHDRRIVDKIEQITGFKEMIPDSNLYAGGLSSMGKNSFLNPHLDNSHNDEKSFYRVLNLLYYVSENWKLKDGGNLILFPHGMKQPSVTIESKFNRLVLMETNDLSYHGVSKVTNESPRRCVSNYYFSKFSTNGKNYSHVTSFYIFPSESKLKSIALTIDRNLRRFLSSSFKKLIKHENWHKRTDK